MFEHFFAVGAQRSGTTYLYRLLDEHPEIEMAKPLRPEPRFVLNEAFFERGLEFYESHFFEGKSGAWLRGEKSTSCGEVEKAAQRLARCFPTSKILFLLRDPIKRAISNYQFSVSNGFETASMAGAFLDEEARWLDYDRERVSVSPYAYLRRGRYIEHISMYERYFPVENIRIMLFEQLVGSAEHVRGLYKFLGVGADFVPSTLNEVVNAGDRPAVALSPELERYLVGYFSEPNARLAERLGLDLVEWRLG